MPRTRPPAAGAVRMRLPWPMRCAVGALLLWACAPLHGAGAIVPTAGQESADEALSPAAPAHRAVLYRPSSDRQTLLLQPMYHGPQSEFCWLIPVPSPPGTRDVFLASRDFMDAVFSRTAPVMRTEPAGAASEEPPRPPDLWAAAPLETGDYGVAVLSPRTARDLGRWLKSNGYRASAGLEEAARDYAERGWSLVAISVNPPSHNARHVLRPLKPIGIHMRTPQAVWPLGISRVGARTGTVVQIVVIAPVPVLCKTMTTVDARGARMAAPGAPYEARLPRLAAGGLVREAVVRGPSPYRDLHYDTLEWVMARRAPWEDLWATRFWGLLARDSLGDLVFVADEKAKPWRVHAQHAPLGRPEAGTWRAGPVPELLQAAILLLAGLCLWALGLSADQRVTEDAPHFLSSIAFAARVFVYVGGVLLLRPALLGLAHDLTAAPGPLLFLTGQLPLEATLAWGGGLTLWALCALAFVARSVRGGIPAPWLFRGLAAAAATALLVRIVFLSSPGVREATDAGSALCLGIAQFTAMLALVALAMLSARLAHGALLGPARIQLRAAEMGLLCAVALIIGPPLHGGWAARGEPAPAAGRPAPMAALEDALGTLREAIADFVEEHGAFPASPAALTARPLPAAGLDAAGNSVPLAGRARDVPYLAELPRDPYTGSAARWTYNPLLPGWVASGGMTTTITTSTTDAATAPTPESYWKLPGAAALRNALGPMGAVLRGAREALMRVEHEGPAGTVIRAADIPSLTAHVVRMGDAAGLDEPRLSAAPGGIGLFLATVVRRDETGGDSRAAVFDVPGARRRLTPLGPPIEGIIEQLQSSPDGVRAACVIRRAHEPPGAGRLWLLDAEGVWVGPLVDGAARIAWHPVEPCVLALARDPEESASHGLRLVRAWPDGRLDPLVAGLRYSDRFLVATEQAVMVVTTAGTLERVDLKTARTRSVDVGPGEALDALDLGGGRVAALARLPNADDGAPRGRLVVVDERGGKPVTREPVAPEGVPWTQGRIIGRHDATGYFFLHLWEDDVAAGMVVLLGEKDGPPQEVPLRDW